MMLLRRLPPLALLSHCLVLPQAGYAIAPSLFSDHHTSPAAPLPQLTTESTLVSQAVPPRETLPPSQQPPDFREPSPLPPPTELQIPSQPTPVTPPAVPGEVPEVIVVERFEVVGSTVFSEAELATVTTPYTQRPLTFNELFEVRSQITDLYVENGYVTSAAILPPQTLTAGVVQIQVIEGRLEDIVVTGTQDLRPDYVRSRIEAYGASPLNVNRLLDWSLD